MSRHNRQIVLAGYPRGVAQEADFRLVETPLRALGAGEFLIRNLYLSLDAGFRQWMNPGASDNYLKAMALDAPVMSITLGRVTESRHAGFSPGDLVMGRNAWEEYSIADGGDFLTRLPPELPFPLSYYLGILGPTGLTAYFGLFDIGAARAGEVVLVSAAAGAVGSAAGQFARVRGCRVVGLTGSDEKCDWLTGTLGFHAAINYRTCPDLSARIRAVAADGIDVYFDNVGGRVLEDALACLRTGARIVLCGAVADYVATAPRVGPTNLFELITKRASMRGYMFTDYAERYPEAIARIGEWLRQGAVSNAEQIVTGIEHTPAAFKRLFEGGNRGKLLVELP